MPNPARRRQMKRIAEAEWLIERILMFGRSKRELWALQYLVRLAKRGGKK